MPLHLLGKKSWNVYNVANIEKVKRDEAIAQAAEEAEEQRMQEHDAQRRLQILRGETPTPLADIEAPSESGKRERRDHGSGREPKRRKKAGENDTDFEMRIAVSQTSSADAKQITLRKESNAPLVDHRGHIDLFPQKIEKHPEVEKEAARRKKEYEDQYTMRFSNAAGLQQQLSAPWYSNTGSSKEVVDEDSPGKNAFGREDPHRKERDAARIVSNDPLAMMKAGARQVREVKKEREAWVKEKEREMRELDETEARSKRKRKHRDDESDLEDFRLDDDNPQESRERSRERHSSRSHRHRNRSGERRHHRDKSRRSSHREDSRERSRHRHHRRD